MAYDLSFTEEFFTGTEPSEDMEVSATPTSVLQAIISLDKATQVAIARDVLKHEHPVLHTMSESFIYEVLDKVRETNTCGTLTSPVAVWIDPDRCYTLEIYD